MAEAKIWRSDVTLELSLSISEKEARALDALAGYGIDSFLEVFYKQLGSVYLKQHEDGLRSLFGVIRAEVVPMLRRADNARAAFRG